MKKQITYKIVVNLNDKGSNKAAIPGKDEFDNIDEAMQVFKSLDVNRLNDEAYYELEQYVDGEITPIGRDILAQHGYDYNEPASWLTKSK